MLGLEATRGMLWRLVTGVALVALIILSVVIGSNVLTGRNDWDRVTSGYNFNLIQWEFENFFNKWAYRVEQAFRTEGLSQRGRIQLVKNFLSLDQEISLLKTKLDAAKAEGAHSVEDIAIWEEQLATLAVQRNELENQAEEIIESQISKLLSDEGFSVTLKLGGEADLIFPPLDFRFEERPNVLIISPRDHIEIIDTALLRPDMKIEEKVEVEDRVKELGFSALVEQVGAVATYPSMIPSGPSLRSLLSRVAHEWLHQYLFFRPLGQSYWSNYEVTIINETVADIAGDEIGSLVYQRYYYPGEEEEAIPPAEEPGESAFDFTKEMREIRITVDQYLAQGEVETAESYMEERRQFLEDNGYYIRKLNQAYFAFYGTYADTPTSVSPIGDQLRELRERSASLEDFIRTVSRISSYEELLELVGEEITS